MADDLPIVLYPRKKASLAEIKERREKVLKMRLKGKSMSDIAQDLGVSPMSVKRDLDAIRKINSARVNNQTQEDIVAEATGTYDLVVEESWREYETRVPFDPGKLQALNTIRMATNDKIRLMEDVGLVKKEALVQAVQHSFQIPWDDSLKEAIIHTLLQTKLSQLEAPVPESDIIEVEEVKPPDDVEPPSALLQEDENDEEDDLD